MNKPNASVLTEIRRFCVSKLTLVNALLAISFIGARGRMRFLLGLAAFVSGGALATAQPVGCAPNTANYPCVYVANASDGTVSVINAITNTVIATDTVTVGRFPEGLAVTPNNTSVYVANSGGGTVSVIDSGTDTIATTIPTQNSPFQIAITPDGTHAYVTEFQAEDAAAAHGHRAWARGHRTGKMLAGRPLTAVDLVEVIDTATNAVVGGIATPNVSDPTAITFSPNGALAYVSDTCSTAPGSFNKCVEVFSTGDNPQYVTTVQIPGTSGFDDGSIAITPDGSLVCVSVLIPGASLGVALINTSNNTLVTILDTQASDINPYAFAMTADGLLYAGTFFGDGGEVYLINTVSKVVSPILSNASIAFTGAGLAPNGVSIYLSNAGGSGSGNTVSVVNPKINCFKTNCVMSTITVGTNPQGVAAMQVLPIPLINQPLVPDATPAGGSAFTLTVNGTGFASKASVNWNGTVLPTTFVSGSQLTASVPAPNIATATTASITVTNPAPGGGTSNPVFFPVTSPTAGITLSKTDYATGNDPWSVATGDFNQDGKLDLAVANNETPGAVSILLGKGDGTFQPQSVYSTGSGSALVWVVTGDFNGDGKLDLAVADIGNNVVWVLLGNGDGTFQSPKSFAAGLGPQSIAVGDFNGDGKLDLAVTNYINQAGGNTVSILLGNGDGTFQPQVTFPTDVNPSSVVAGDFNGDGILDLAVANGSGTVSILLGNGDGTFQPQITFPAGAQPYQLVTADFNRDGKLDLAVTNADSAVDTISILLGNGDGTFQPPVAYGTGTLPEGISTGDLNGDGNLDLAVTNQSNNNVSVLLGNGDGTFQAQMVFPTSADPIGIAIGDFNEDGRLDIVTSDIGGTNTVSVLLQSPTATVSPTSLNFGNEPVGKTSPSQQVTITNNGSAPLIISNISITGANSGDFKATPCSLPAEVLPGGSCNVQIDFTPSNTGPRRAALSITDNAPGSPQSVGLTGVGISPVVITTTPLPNGTVGFPYNQTLQATGGTPPYSWTLTTGSLPPPLTLSTAGIILGIPTTTGTYNFTVMATDAKGFSATAPLQIVVVQSQAPVITTQPANQTINPLQTATLTVVATGAPPPTYQWYEGQTGDTSIPIPGATNSSYTTPPLTTNTTSTNYQYYSYWVQVSNGVSPAANSATATISINLTCTLTVGGSVSSGSNPLSITATAACTDLPGQSFTTSIDWGDKTPPATGTGSLTASHTYATYPPNGFYVITATATTTSGTTTSTSSPLTLVAQAPGVFPGQTSDVQVMLPKAPAGVVTFICTTVTDSSGVTKQASDLGISCSSVPSPVTLPTTPQQPTITITIATTGPASGSIAPSLRRGKWLVAMWLPLAALVLFGAGWRKPGMHRRGLAPCLAGGALVLVVLLFASCGGGFTAPIVKEQAATPAGNYQVTVVSQPAPGQVTTGFVQTSLIVPLPVSPTP